jgi:hypothetical protein
MTDATLPQSPSPASPKETGAAIAPSKAPNLSATSDLTTGVDLNWVWREVRKRVFIQGLDFSRDIGDALASAIPIVLDGNSFVVGFEPRNFPLAPALNGTAVKNTIEKILEQAAGKRINFEVIEGTLLSDWEHIKLRRDKAQSAIIAMATSQAETHHFEDVMSQIVGEVRQRVSQIHDRAQPVVRAALILDVAATLADAEDMLFNEAETREGKRVMSRIVDRIATFLDVPSITLAIEIERYRRATKKT